MIPHHAAISRAFSAGCALALVVSACGSSPATQSSATVGPADSSATAGSVPTTEPDADERYVSPLDAFLGLGNGKDPTDAQIAEDNQHRLEAEQLVATCMQDQGFEYVAAVRPNDGVNLKDSIRALSPAQFAAQYGYGITTIDREVLDDGWTNPNDAIVAAMSVAQRAAYFHALYGDLITIDAEGHPIKSKDRSAQPTPTSCVAQADTAVFGPPTTDADSTTQDSFTALQDSIRALSATIDQDPSLDPLRSAWTDCMAAAGHPGYTDLGAARNEVNQRADDLVGDDSDRSAADPVALSELRAFEISVATADLDCSHDLDAAYHVLQTQAEDAFIEQNRTELEQFRDALAAGTARVSKG